jgi:hypothetical protein
VEANAHHFGRVLAFGVEGIEGIFEPEWQPDIVLCSGDMVAGQSLDLSASEIAAMWTAFDRQIAEPIRAAGLPFAITAGNHDGSSYREGGDFIYVLDRQEMAKYWAGHQSDSDLTFVEAGGFPFYYSFKQNDIFYLVWDASSANVPPEQVAWADRALASAEAQTAKLRIVMGHLPMYAVAQRRDLAGECPNQGDELRQLLERHDVHSYISRLWPRPVTFSWRTAAVAFSIRSSSPFCCRAAYLNECTTSHCSCQVTAPALSPTDCGSVRLKPSAINSGGCSGFAVASATGLLFANATTDVSASSPRKTGASNSAKSAFETCFSDNGHK